MLQLASISVTVNQLQGWAGEQRIVGSLWARLKWEWEATSTVPCSKRQCLGKGVISGLTWLHLKCKSTKSRQGPGDRVISGITGLCLETSCLPPTPRLDASAQLGRGEGKTQSTDTQPWSITWSTELGRACLGDGEQRRLRGEMGGGRREPIKH